MVHESADVFQVEVDAVADVKGGNSVVTEIMEKINLKRICNCTISHLK